MGLGIVGLSYSNLSSFVWLEDRVKGGECISYILLADELV